MRVIVDDIAELIAQAVREVSEQFNLCLESNQDLPLSPASGVFDSLAFVNLIAAVEDLVQRRFGVEVCLTDESNDDPDSQRFRSVRALASFISQQIPNSSL